MKFVEDIIVQRVGYFGLINSDKFNVMGKVASYYVKFSDWSEYGYLVQYWPKSVLIKPMVR